MYAYMAYITYLRYNIHHNITFYAYMTDQYEGVYAYIYELHICICEQLHVETMYYNFDVVPHVSPLSKFASIEAAKLHKRMLAIPLWTALLLPALPAKPRAYTP